MRQMTLGTLMAALVLHGIGCYIPGIGQRGWAVPNSQMREKESSAAGR